MKASALDRLDVTTPTPIEDNDVTQAEATAMLRAAFNLFARWQLDSAQSRRLGDLMGIHKALRYMFSEPQRGYEWIRMPSHAFGGRSALDRMLQGAPSDLSMLRAYLDAERAGW